MKTRLIPTNTRCIGSEKVGRHKLFVTEEGNHNQLCMMPECDILYYNVESNKWTYKPDLKTKKEDAIETI